LRSVANSAQAARLKDVSSSLWDGLGLAANIAHIVRHPSAGHPQPFPASSSFCKRNAVIIISDPKAGTDEALGRLLKDYETELNREKLSHGSLNRGYSLAPNSLAQLGS